MNTRSLKYFISCALLGVITLSGAWAQDQTVVHDEFGPGAGAGAGVALVEEVVADEMSVSALQVTLASKANTADAGESRTDDAGSAIRCGFIANQSLNPEFENLISAMCPRQQANKPGYCECVRLYLSDSRGAGIKRIVTDVENQMKRVGYQLLLESWVENYGANVLAVASLNQRTLGSEVAEALPNECNPSRMLQNLRMVRAEASCSTPNPAFEQALNAVLRVREGSVLDPTRPNNEVTNLFATREEYDRMYLPPRGGRHKNFRDCMEPAEKRAYALLPIEFTVTSTPESAREATNRLRRLEKMKVALSDMISGGGSFTKDDLYHLNPMFDIFPGLETLLTPTAGLGTADKIAVFTQLRSFVNDLEDPSYRNFRDVRSSADVMARMKRNVDATNTLISTKIRAADAVNRNVTTEITQSCNNLNQELEAMACGQENHVNDPIFMAYAYQDVNRRGTRARETGVGERSMPFGRFAQCQLNDVEERGAVGISDCLAYHQAQCSSIQRNVGAKAVSAAPGAPQTFVPRIDALRVSSEMEAAQELRSDEEQMVQFVCADFNQYLRTQACAEFAPSQGSGNWDGPNRAARHTEADQRNDQYRSCILRQTVAQYRATTGGDPRLNALVDNGSWNPVSVSGALSTRGDGGGGELGTTTLAEANTTTVVRTTTADSLANTIHKATGNLGATGTGIGTPTGIIPIDPPAARTDEGDAAALAQRLLARQDADEERRRSEARIEEIGPNPQDESMAAELRRLQAEIAASRARSEQLTAEIDSLKGRMTSSAVAEVETGVADANRRSVDNRTGGPGVGFGGGGRSPASLSPAGSGGSDQGSPAFSPEINRASVNTNFGGASASRGLIEAARNSLPAAALNPLALRVGDASYPVGQVYTVKIPAGEQANDADILRRIFEARASITLDAQQRAMVEIFDETTRQSRVVYVQFSGDAVTFLPYDPAPPGGAAANVGVRATLAQLEGLIGAGRGAVDGN